jgi:integrase
VEELETERLLSSYTVLHADLIKRMRSLGEGREWIFQSRAGTPVNLGNARSRYLQPRAAAIGVRIGGWHDFRHTLIRSLRRAGVNPVVISGVVGPMKAEMAAEVYDKASGQDLRLALAVMGNRLLPQLLPSGSVAVAE